MREKKFQPNAWSREPSLSILLTRLDDGTILDANADFLETTGYSHREVIGKSAAELQNWVDPEDRKRFVASLKAIGRCDAMQTAFRGKNGRIITALISARRIDVAGVSCVLSITVDLSEIEDASADLETVGQMLRHQADERTCQLLSLNAALQKEFEGWRKTQQDLHLFKAIVESSNEAIAVSDPKGNLVYINRAHEKLFGRSLDEARQMNCRDYYPPDSVKILEEQVAPALVRGESWEGELDVCDAAGRRFALWERVDAVRSRDGSLLFGIGFMHDVSERRKSEELLQQRTRALRERVKELHCLYGISKLVSETGRSLAGILQGVVELIPPAFQYPDLTCARIVLKNRQYRSPNYQETGLKIRRNIIVRSDAIGTLEVGCLQAQHSNGASFFLEEEKMLLSTIAERLGRIIEREQAQKNIQALSQALIDAQENERLMISSELHDRVAQDLSAAKISCDMMIKPSESLSETATGGLQELSRSLEKTIMAVRDLSYEMRPPGLEEMGLVQSVEILCREFGQKSSLRIDFQSAGMARSQLPSTAAISLYRLVQEALTNVHKHARAKKVVVRLVQVYPHIVVRIEDDGRGFDVHEVMSRAAPEKRMGLISMQQRAKILDGKLDIRSAEGKGTKIRLKIPSGEVENGG